LNLQSSLPEEEISHLETYLDGAITTFPFFRTSTLIEGKFITRGNANPLVFTQSIIQLTWILTLAIGTTVSLETVASVAAV